MRSKLTKAENEVQSRGNGRQSLPAVRARRDRAKRDEVFDLIPVPVVMMDRDHTILNLNPTAAQAAGKPLEDCIGLKFWDLFDSPGCRAGTCAAAQAIRTGAVATGEARPKVQGVEMPVRVVAAPRFDAGHEVIGVVEVIHSASEENRLNLEILRLVEAARGGQLSERGRVGDFQSTQRELLEGINAMLEAVISPLNVAANYVDRISKGDLPPQITDTYHGEFNTIKNNLNALIGAMNDVTHAAEEIAQGNLTVAVRERSAQDKLMQALSSHGGRADPHGDRDPRHRRRSGGRQPGHQHRLGAGVQRRQRPGGFGRGSLILDGGNGFQHQAECRQRAADREDRHQVGQGRAGERQVACWRRSRR